MLGKTEFAGSMEQTPSVGDDNFEQTKAVLIQNLLRIWNTAKGQNEFGNEFEWMNSGSTL